MNPTIIFDFFGLTISIKVDSSSFFYRYLGHFDIYMIDDQQSKEGYHLQKSQLEQTQKNNY